MHCLHCNLADFNKGTVNRSAILGRRPCDRESVASSRSHFELHSFAIAEQVRAWHKEYRHHSAVVNSKLELDLCDWMSKCQVNQEKPTSPECRYALSVAVANVMIPPQYSLWSCAVVGQANVNTPRNSNTDMTLDFIGARPTF